MAIERDEWRRGYPVQSLLKLRFEIVSVVEGLATIGQIKGTYVESTATPGPDGD